MVQSLKVWGYGPVWFRPWAAFEVWEFGFSVLGSGLASAGASKGGMKLGGVKEISPNIIRRIYSRDPLTPNPKP